MSCSTGHLSRLVSLKRHLKQNIFIEMKCNNFYEIRTEVVSSLDWPISSIYRSEEIYSDDLFDQSIWLTLDRQWIKGWNRTPNHNSYDDMTFVPLIYKNVKSSSYKHFPNLSKYLDKFDNIFVAGLSRIKPGCFLDRHVDIVLEDGETLDSYCPVKTLNMAIICPSEGCTLKQYHPIEGETTHVHKEGSSVIFDCRTPHAAFNDSKEERVVLAVNYIV